jgi:hypothetical protein
MFDVLDLLAAAKPGCQQGVKTEELLAGCGGQSGKTLTDSFKN